jgi:hypothetical protein
MVEIFGLTKFGRFTDKNINFRDFGSALLSVLVLTTGEGWNFVMHDLTVAPPYCNSDALYLLNDCGSVSWSYVLFLTFYFICNFILLNLFLVAVLDNFSHAFNESSEYARITKKYLKQYPCHEF